jgi:K+-sensing histidine kinase KdpD
VKIIIFPENKSSSKEYLLAFGCVVLAGAGRALLDQWLGNTHPFSTFLLALIFVVSRFGLGPSIFALVLSLAAANYFFLDPRYTFMIKGTAEQIGYMIDMICGVSVVFFLYFIRRLQDEINKEKKNRLQRK